MSSSTPKKKKPKVRKQVGPGDIVSIHSPFDHMTGRIGEVVQRVGKDAVVIKGVGARYEQYDGQMWVVKTYKPRGRDKEGTRYCDQQMWIRKVLFRKGHFIPKPKKPVMPPKVLKSVEELVQHLASDTDEKVVYRPDDPPTTEAAA